MAAMQDNTVDLSQQTRAKESLWGDFVQAKTAKDLCHAWLGLICEKVNGASMAAVLIESQEAQTYVPMAVWPEVIPNMSRLATVVESALRERRGIVQAANLSQTENPPSNAVSATNPMHIAYPLMSEQRVIAVVALEAYCASEEVNQILRDIHWASAWLSNLFAGREVEEAMKAKVRMESVLEVIAITLRHGKLQQVLFEMVNELRQRLACSRIAIGMVNHASVQLTALSEAATFEKNTSLVKAYRQAMDEAYDYGKVVLYDKTSEKTNFPRHQALSQISGSTHVISCPLFEGGLGMGVLVLERPDKAFDEVDVAWLDVFTTMVAPIISQRKQAEHNALARLAKSCKAVLTKLWGPRYLMWKMITVAILTILALLLFVQMDYRVTAKTVIEGEVQRMIAAPFEGFIASSYVRAGDTVKQGQLLAHLDDRELIIEKARWSSEREQYNSRLREAMATHDLSAVQVLGAQLSQAEAQLTLVTKKIEHSHLVAPFDGLVVSGDLSQQIGAPVEVGKKLFEIAPLQSYRVILQVDEREIRHIKRHQTGTLVITGFAEHPLPLKIQKITPVATDQDGKNFFRVEASLSEVSVRLRPGMEGVGKVVTDRQPLRWILLHSFTDWLRLTLWTWMP